MAAHYLSLRFHDDGDGTGNLQARAQSRGFAGQGGAYFGVRQIEGFAGSIARYPLASRCEIRGGFWKKDRSHELKQEHLAVSVYPVGSRGYIGVQVRIATEVSPSTRPESQSVVKLEFITSYERLRKFSKDLISLVHGTAHEATIESESF
jgi:hypothetical protein